MSHYTRELPDTGYYRGMKIPHLLPRNIDEKTKKAVTSSGGTWAPSTPIIIAGAGVELQCSLVFTGTAKAAPVAGSAFVFGDDDYFKFSSPISRTIVHPVVFADILSHPKHFKVSMLGFGLSGDTVPNLQNIRFSQDGIPRGAEASIRIPLKIPDGAILTSLTLGFITGFHVAVPQYMPKMRVVRIAADGTISPFPGGTTTGTDPLFGWVSPPIPANAAAWNNGAARQTFAMSFNANGTPVDRSTYDYAFEYLDESGANATPYPGGATVNRLYDLTMVVKQSDLRPY